jgi:hypothetical protein
MAKSNPLAEFGGQIIEEKSTNPLAEFGAEEISAEANPLAEFGGGPVLQEPVPSVSASRAATLGTVQGVSFNFADELEAAIASLGSKETYEDAVKRVRKKYEDAEKAQKLAYLGGEVAGGLATMAVPGLGALKGASLLKNVGQAAALGAATGLGRTEDISNIPETIKDVAGEAAFGAGIVGGIAGVGKAYRAFKGGPKEAKELAEGSIEALKKGASKGSVEILDEVEAIARPLESVWAKEVDELTKVIDNGGEISGTLKQNLLDFSESIGGKRNELDALKAVKDLKSRLSPEDFKRQYTNFKKLDAVDNKLAQLSVEEPDIKTKLRVVRNASVDGMSKARNIDGRKGTDFYGAFLSATANINRYTVELARFLKAKVSLGRNYYKLDEEAKSILNSALRGEGKFAGLGEEAIASSPLLSKEVKEQYTGWRKFLNDEAALVQKDTEQRAGIPLQIRKNYVPDQMMDTPNTILALEKKIAESAKAAGINPLRLAPDVDVTEFAKEGSPMRDLYRAVYYLTGEAPTNAEDFSRVLRSSLEPGADIFSKELKASALFERTGLMPDFLKEKDIAKLANKWGQQVYRYAYLKNDLADIKQQAEYLKKTGAKADYEQIMLVYNEYLGQARFIADATRKAKVYIQTRALKAADKATDPVSKKFYTFMAEAPDVFQNMVLNVYPNFLGASPRAVVQNLLGGLYMAVPELGNMYGAKSVIPAYLKALKNMGSREYWKKLEESGFIAAQFSTELKESIRSGAPPGIVGQAADNLAEKVMLGFEWSEKLNRAVVYESGKMVAADVIAGGKSALKYLDTMPKRVKAQVLEAAEAGNLELTENLVTRYLADRTMFSYNRMTSSDISRAVGPLFSMFTKYPSAIGGRVLDTFAEKGGVGGLFELGRFVAAPLMAGTAINLLFERGGDAEEILFGKPKNPDAPLWARGAALSSPFWTVKSIAEGRMFTPPLVGATKETILGAFELLEGEPDRLGRAIKNTAKAFTPGGVPAIIRLLEQMEEVTGTDIPLIEKGR